MSQVKKLPLKIVMDRMKWKIEAEGYDAREDFDKEKGQEKFS